MHAALAWLFLVVFGSLVGFTAYIWLLGVTSIAKAGTYAYVNPIVAVLLGWAVLGEPVTMQNAGRRGRHSAWAWRLVNCGLGSYQSFCACAASGGLATLVTIELLPLHRLQ